MAPRRISVNEEGSVLGGLVGFEELVEWRGPVGSSGELGPSQLYTMEGEDFFFPLIDEDAAHSRMAYRRPKDKHARFKKEPKIQGCEEKDEAQIPQYKTTVLESRHLDGIRKNYHIPLSYKIIYPEVSQRIHTMLVICVTTYVAHLRAGLQFPLHPLFVDICKYYGVQLGQLMLNVIRTTVGFLMACRAFGCECLLKLWRRLYVLCQKCKTLEDRGFFYIARRSAHFFIVGLSSIYSWKNEFFYVKHSSFEGSGILVPWNNRKAVNNDMPEGYE